MRRWFLVDWGTKLGAVLLAAAFWFHAVTEHSYRREILVPLVVLDPVTPAGETPILLASKAPSMARVAVFGAGKDLLRTNGDDFLLRVQAPPGQPGTRLTVRLGTNQVEDHSDLDVTVEEVVEPRELSVILDRRVERRVPVHPRVDLRPAESYTQVGPLRIDPDSVLILGPRTQVDSIMVIDTEDSLFREGVRDDVDWELALRPPGGSLVEMDRDRVRVRIDVQELAEYEIPNVPVRVQGGPLGTGTEPSRVTVRVRGGADLIGSLDPEADLGLYVDYGHWAMADSMAGLVEAPADRPFQVRLVVPARVEVVAR